MAEHLLKKMAADIGWDVAVSSAGISPALDMRIPKEALEALKREGVTQAPHYPKPLTADMVEKAGLILAMDESHQEMVRRLFPKAKDRVFLLKSYAGVTEGKPGIADPYGGALPVYLATMAEIKSALTKIIQKEEKRRVSEN